MMVVNCCVSVPFVKRLHSMRMHCYVISVKKWVLLENQHYIPNIEDIFTKFTRHPMNWTNIMSSKGQVYAIKIVDFISKTEGPLYFEQVGISNRHAHCFASYGQPIIAIHLYFWNKKANTLFFLISLNGTFWPLLFF